jgi:hypothetical protein
MICDKCGNTDQPRFRTESYKPAIYDAKEKGAAITGLDMSKLTFFITMGEAIEFR